MKKFIEILFFSLLLSGINKATAIVGLNPGAAPINKPPTVPNIRIKIFAKVNTFEK